MIPTRTNDEPHEEFHSYGYCGPDGGEHIENDGSSWIEEGPYKDHSTEELTEKGWI